MIPEEKKRRRDALAIFRAALEAAEPKRAVLAHLTRRVDHILAGPHRIGHEPGGRIFVVGAGKAAGPMAQAVEELLGEEIAGGVVVTKYGHGVPLNRIDLLEAGHPLPDAAGAAAAEAVMDLARLAGESDLVLCLLSGGGSSLLPAPVEGISLEEKLETTALLLQCGASIGEINAVRKHLSEVKGGGLARLAAPARVLTLILSDVVGDPPEVIASGPTAPDPCSFADALEVVDRYGLRDRIPAGVLDLLSRGAEGKVRETPKPGDGFFSRVTNLIVGSNALAVSAGAEKARSLGYNTLILSTSITGETREVAKVHGAAAREILSSGNPLQEPACLLSGGETTVTVRGKGKGGRNQEFVLAAAVEIAGLPRTTIMSAGTDGTDGPTEAAGAVADGETLARAKEAGLRAGDFLADNDSYHFFKAIGDLVVTGPTHTNVMDLRIVLVGQVPSRNPGRNWSV